MKLLILIELFSFQGGGKVTHMHRDRSADPGVPVLDVQCV